MMYIDQNNICTRVALLCTEELNQRSVWHKAIAEWDALLKPEEKFALVVTVLQSMPISDIKDVFRSVVPPGVGPPVAPLLGFLDEALNWAAFAEPKEIEAYCLACFKAMPGSRQVAFMDYVKREKRHET